LPGVLAVLERESPAGRVLLRLVLAQAVVAPQHDEAGWGTRVLLADALRFGAGLGLLGLRHSFLHGKVTHEQTVGFLTHRASSEREATGAVFRSARDEQASARKSRGEQLCCVAEQEAVS